MQAADVTGGRRRPLARALCLALGLLVVTASCAGEPVAPEPILRMELTPETAVISEGDIVHVTALVMDENGTPVQVGPATVATDDPSVAVIDAASRLRAVSPGRTRLRGTAGGVVGSVTITVDAAPARFVLERFESGGLPVVVAADSVDWDGEREYHEVLVVSGAFALTGGAQPRYELVIRYEEYAVRNVGGERTASLRLRWNDYDRGTIVFDATGDLEMTSEIVAPLHHRSSSVPGGFLVDFRIPGTDDRLDLFYRR